MYGIHAVREFMNTLHNNTNNNNNWEEAMKLQQEGEQGEVARSEQKRLAAANSGKGLKNVIINPALLGGT